MDKMNIFFSNGHLIFTDNMEWSGEPDKGMLNSIEVMVSTLVTALAYNKDVLLLILINTYHSFPLHSVNWVSWAERHSIGAP